MSWRARSFDALPALSVRGPRLRSALRRVTLAWMFGVVWLSCVSGGHVRIFARMLGFNDFAFGLMSAIPFLATFGQIVASALIERTGVLKYQFVTCAAVHRGLWWVIALIPLLLPIPSRAATAAMLTVLGLSWLTQSLSAPAWMTWMGRLVPRRIRGRYFANRARLSMTGQAVVVIGIGLIMDALYDPAAGDSAAAQPAVLHVVCAIFALAGVFGLIDILLFRKVPEVLPPAPPPAAARAAPRRMGLRRFILEPLGDRAFRSYVLYGATIAFSLTVAGWYLWLNAMENLGFSNLATNVLFLVIAPGAGVLSARGWGAAIDRWGRRPLLIVATAGSAVGLLPWFFLSPQAPGAPWTYLAAAATCLLSGALWTGVTLAETGIVLGFADGNGQSRYVAASAVLISAGGALGGLAGGALTQSLAALRADPVRLGPLALNNWHAAFAVALAARALAIVWLIGMPEPRALPVRNLVRMMWANAFSNARTRVFYPLRVFGWRRAARRRRPGGPQGPPSAPGP